MATPTQTQETPVRAQVVVEAPIERAFAVFTDGIGTWFPAEYNMLAVEIAERVFEPRVGGHVFDRGIDGTECHWGRVMAYEPPKRVVISWNINPNWQIEADRAIGVRRPLATKTHKNTGLPFVFSVLLCGLESPHSEFHRLIRAEPRLAGRFEMP